MDLMGGNGTTWIAPIRFECTASELIEHVESCLKPLGYMRMAVGSQKRDIKSEIQVELYYSPDWKTKVTVDTLSNQLSVDLSQVVFMEMKLYQMSEHIKLEEL